MACAAFAAVPLTRKTRGSPVLLGRFFDDDVLLPQKECDMSVEQLRRIAVEKLAAAESAEDECGSPC